MTILSDKDIKSYIQQKRITIEPFLEENIGPSSVDLRLDNKFLIFKHSDITHVDPRNVKREELMSEVLKDGNNPFIIHPGEFILSNTIESVTLPADIVGRLDGRSSWGRLGIIVHSTAGNVHPGFSGQLTLEIANISKLPVCLYPGSKICQIAFQLLSSPAEKPYNVRKESKYLNQQGPGASKIDQEN